MTKPPPFPRPGAYLDVTDEDPPLQTREPLFGPNREPLTYEEVMGLPPKSVKEPHGQT